MVAVNPPILPGFLPELPNNNYLRSLAFYEDLGGWEDNAYTPAHPHMRRARVRVYVSIIPSSQKERVYIGFKGLGFAQAREFGLGAGRIA